MDLLEEEADDEVCVACLDADSYDDNQILYCDKCNIVTSVCLLPNPGPDADFVRILTVFDRGFFQASNLLR